MAIKTGLDLQSSIVAHCDVDVSSPGRYCFRVSKTVALEPGKPAIDTKKIDTAGPTGPSLVFYLASAGKSRASTQKGDIAQSVPRVRANFFTNIQWIRKGSKPWKNGQHYFGGSLKLGY